MSSSTKSKYSFYVLLYLVTCIFSVVYGPQPLLPFMAKSFNVSNEAINLIITASILPLCVTPIIFGLYMHNFSIRNVLIVGLIAIALLGLILSYTDNFHIAVLTRLLQGFFVPAVLTSSLAYISDNFKGEELQKALGLYVAVNIIGSLGGRIFLGYVATDYGWRIAMASIVILAFFGLFFLFNFNAGEREKTVDAKFSDYLKILKIPGVTSTMFLEFFSLYVFMGLTNILPFRLIEVMGENVSPLFISIFYISFVAGFFGSYFSPKLVKITHGRAKLVAICFFMYAISFFLLLANNIYALFIGLSLVCLFRYLERSIVPGLIDSMAEEYDSGIVNGIAMSIFYLGGAIGAYIPSMIYHRVGWNEFVLSLSLMIFIAFIFSLNSYKYAKNL